MVQLWTDGSHQQGSNIDNCKCGIGILIRRLAPDLETSPRKFCEHKFSLGLNKVKDNNLAELYAIEYGLYKLSQLNLHPKDKKLVIITDSKVAINLIKGISYTHNPEYIEAVKDIKWQLRKYDYNLYWKKGHSDCERQNLCDMLAHKGRLQGERQGGR